MIARGLSIVMALIVAGCAESDSPKVVVVGSTVTGLALLPESDKLVFSASGSTGTVALEDHRLTAMDWNGSFDMAVAVTSHEGVCFLEQQTVTVLDLNGNVREKIEFSTASPRDRLCDVSQDLTLALTSRCLRSALQTPGISGDSVTILSSKPKSKLAEFDRETLPTFSRYSNLFVTATTPPIRDATELIVRDARTLEVLGIHPILAEPDCCAFTPDSDGWVLGLRNGDIVRCTQTGVEFTTVSQDAICCIWASKQSVVCVDSRGTLWRVQLNDQTVKRIASEGWIHPSAVCVFEKSQIAAIGSCEGSISFHSLDQ